ncbi:hypothetical protein CUM95_01670 [Enterococcus faecium]|nr:hypothetical protein LK32_00845 [Enterococcus hirae]PCE03388.1 hypothetical protein CKY13_14755 [Enterococcus hirae]PQC42709.1 hypothetical protein CUM95_01670 [Enterococcus faecium]
MENFVVFLTYILIFVNISIYIYMICKHFDLDWIPLQIIWGTWFLFVVWCLNKISSALFT